ncbi:hypothetical protein [Peribacillus kribbensis]|uniref:hypothetical protein n=1 Tax=Peribacillus kribbensis TaxID=356658 RepID=UPI000426550B|nr:hypothetical protein [Peribacillus kribbensis]
MANEEKERYLEERNDTNKAFQKDQQKQLERDQTLMPVDDLPLEDIKEEMREERDRDESKNQSSSEKKLNGSMGMDNDLPDPDRYKK